MKLFLALILMASFFQAMANDAVELEAALSLESPEIVSDAQAFLAENAMDSFDSKRLRRITKKYGKEFANEVYANWISSKNFGESCAPLIGSCDYYLCRENLKPCGVKGYYLAFGYQHCQKSFTQLSTRVSERGKVWLTDVATCLQEKVENEISPELECSEIKNASIASHESCYEKTNFCGQKFKDVLKVVGMLSPELAKPRMILLGLRIIKNCVF